MRPKVNIGKTLGIGLPSIGKRVQAQLGERPASAGAAFKSGTLPAEKRCWHQLCSQICRCQDQGPFLGEPYARVEATWGGLDLSLLNGIRFRAATQNPKAQKGELAMVHIRSLPASAYVTFRSPLSPLGQIRVCTARHGTPKCRFWQSVMTSGSACVGNPGVGSCGFLIAADVGHVLSEDMCIVQLTQDLMTSLQDKPRDPHWYQMP